MPNEKWVRLTVEQAGVMLALLGALQPPTPQATAAQARAEGWLAAAIRKAREDDPPEIEP